MSCASTFTSCGVNYPDDYQQWLFHNLDLAFRVMVLVSTMFRRFRMMELPIAAYLRYHVSLHEIFEVCAFVYRIWRGIVSARQEYSTHRQRAQDISSLRHPARLRSQTVCQSYRTISQPGNVILYQSGRINFFQESGYSEICCYRKRISREGNTVRRRMPDKRRNAESWVMSQQRWHFSRKILLLLSGRSFKKNF